MKKKQTAKYKKRHKKELANRKARLELYAGQVEANKESLVKDGLMSPARRAFQDK